MEQNERLPLGNNIITINNQDLEEAEELEDRKRREEEMHNLLSHAMGDFNFDDQSTVNSSIVSKEGDASILRDATPTAFNEQYREANADDQLKILYEVRVRELVALNAELEKLKTDFHSQEQVLKKKATLLEVENERKNISLKEAQSLLVDKTEQIKNLSGQLESTEATAEKLEGNVSELNQEIMVLREANMKFQQQLVLMERGFPLHHQTSDKELRESQRSKITRLESSLDRTMQQSEQKERQHKEMLRELKQSLQEKDDCLAEKCSLINKLTENFETAQERCQELLKTVEELRRVQKATDRTASPLEEELKKMREYNERTDVLCENVRRVVSEEYQGQIAMLNSENRAIKDILHTKENELKDAIEQLQVMSSIEIERGALQTKLKELERKFAELNLYKDSVKQKLADHRKETDLLREKYKLLAMDNESLANVKAENDSLQKQIIDLQSYIHEVMNPTTAERSAQASFSLSNNSEIEILNKEKEVIYNQLVSAHATIDKLENKIQLLLQENVQLKEREGLIKKLQDKAAQFEKIIFEKQKKITVSVETNTETYQDHNSLLKVKYDALLYQTETSLRKKLKQEFDAKLEKVAYEAQQNVKSHICKDCGELRNENRKLHELRMQDRQDCNELRNENKKLHALRLQDRHDCSELRNENKKLHELRMQDRQSVMKLVDNWTEKFGEFEKESQRSMAEAKEGYDRQLISHAIKLEQEYVDKFKKISEHLQKTMKEVEHQRDKLVHSSLRRHNLLSERLNRILINIQQGGNEITAIEKKCSKDKATMEKKWQCRSKIAKY